MDKFKHLRKVKELYETGGNIIEYLKKESNQKLNSVEDILISYDFQAGSYIKYNKQNTDFNLNYCNSIAITLNNLSKFTSIMEVGVGEATTLKTVVQSLKDKPKKVFGFDISWSRLKFAQEYLNEEKSIEANLFCGNLFEIPLPDNSVDVLYTSHSIEPNGGFEREALEELYRVSSKYIVLLEPSYHFANAEQKARMDKHGYVKTLHQTAIELGYNVIDYKLHQLTSNPLNPTELIIIKKNSETKNDPNFVCPISKTPLELVDNVYFSKDSLLSYPIINQIPCLLKENAILTSHLLTNYCEFKRKNNLN